MAAKKKPINTIKVETNIDKRSELLKLEYPEKREEGVIIGEDKSSVTELIRILKEEKKII